MSISGSRGSKKVGAPKSRRSPFQRPATTWSDSAEETREFGRRVGALLRPGDVVALEGDLGAGKTVLVGGIADALGVTAPVRSPSFVLHHRYPGRVPLDHYDLYRLEAGGWLDTGLEEPSPGTVAVVEWSDRAPALMNWCTVHIQLETAGKNRRRLACLKGSDAITACFRGASTRA